MKTKTPEVIENKEANKEKKVNGISVATLPDQIMWTGVKENNKDAYNAGVSFLKKRYVIKKINKIGKVPKTVDKWKAKLSLEPKIL